MAELMDMDRIVQFVKAINVAWNNCHFKVWLGLTLIAFLVGCSSQPEVAKPILDPGGYVVKPTATEMTFMPTMTEAAPLPTASFTPEPTFTPTIEPTEKPKGLAERWDDPEVMARVQEKFEENKPLFDQIVAGTLIYHDENGKEINVQKYMQAYYYSDMGGTLRERTGNMELGGGMVGKKGILFAHERLQYSSTIQVEVGYVAFYNGENLEKPFEFVPVILGVGDKSTGYGASIRVVDNSDDGFRAMVFDSMASLDSYIDAKLMNEHLPLTDVTIISAVNKVTGARDSQAMAEYIVAKMNRWLPSNPQRDMVMQSFILDYYTDQNYPAFPGMASERDAGHWGSTGKWLEEAGKVRMGLIMELLSEFAK